MAENLAVERFAVVASLPAAGSSAKGDTCVLSSNGHLYTFDGSAWVDNGAAGGGGGGPAASGTAIVDFGAGAADAKVTVATAAVGGTSVIKAWLAPINSVATGNREEDEQRVEPLRVSTGNIVVATSFDLFAFCDLGFAAGKFRVAWELY